MGNIEKTGGDLLSWSRGGPEDSSAVVLDCWRGVADLLAYLGRARVGVTDLRFGVVEEEPVFDLPDGVEARFCRLLAEPPRWIQPPLAHCSLLSNDHIGAGE